MNHSFKFLLLGLFTVGASFVCAQNSHPISEYDDEGIRTFNIPELLKNFEGALNIISSESSKPLDKKDVQNRLLYDSERVRSFYNEKVIIENDLDAGAYVNPVKEDLSITNYLENFDVFYKKSEEPSVSFTILKISSLKKSSYFYYNVLFESKFRSTDKDGSQYRTVSRIAEIRLEFDTIWNAYIQAVRFAPRNFNPDDSKNNFIGFVTQYDQLTQAKIDRLEQKKEQQKDVQIKINQIISQGDSYILQEDYPKALERYKAAWSYDMYREDIKEKIENCEKLIEKEYNRKKKSEELEKIIMGLKTRVFKSYANYDFISCKLYLDSLSIYYHQTDNPSLTNISIRLSMLYPFVSRSNMLEQMKDYRNLLVLSSSTLKLARESKAQQDTLLITEALYRSARAYFLIDSTDYRHISKFGDEALFLSHNAHEQCCQLLIRVRMMNYKYKFLALDLATEMVVRDPTSPELRAVRADVLSFLKDPESAIKEYKLAIDLKTNDSMVYINKARIEDSLKHYFNSIATADSGLKLFPCNHNLYYRLVLAQEHLGLYNSAGEDFVAALACGMAGSMKNAINDRGQKYYETGLLFFNRNQPDSAIHYFDKSYKLTRNPGALFFRGYTYMNLQKIDRALSDLTTLIENDSAYKNAYYMRGLINAAGEKHEAAVSDFGIQIKLLPEYWKSYAMCGLSLLKLNRYSEAAQMFKESNKYNYTDTIAPKAILAHYLAGEYEQGIQLAEKYILINNTKTGLVYKYKGLSEYMSGQIELAKNDLSVTIKSMPDDYDANLITAKILLSSGNAMKAVSYADRAARTCKDCPEALIWSGISIISQQQLYGNESGIHKISYAIEKDSSLNTGSNLAWMAYGYLLSHRNMNTFYSMLQAAKKKDPEDRIVLFVNACALAEIKSEQATAIKTLELACSKGFAYKHLIVNDPNLRRVRSELQFKAIISRYFQD